MVVGNYQLSSRGTYEFSCPPVVGATEDENVNPFVVSPPEAETTPFDRLSSNCNSYSPGFGPTSGLTMLRRTELTRSW